MSRKIPVETDELESNTIPDVLFEDEGVEPILKKKGVREKLKKEKKHVKEKKKT